MNSTNGFDAMNARDMISRWVIVGTLVTETAAHFGGESDASLDMPILRCARTGKPLLPGSTMAGALRAYLKDRLSGYSVGAFSRTQNGNSQGDTNEGSTQQTPAEDPRIAKLFGANRGDDSGAQSPLIVFDALGEMPADNSRTEIRDGVLIETKSGTAAPHKKFDFEVLPPGTQFDIRFDVIVPQADQESELIGLLAAALEGLDCGDIALGMRRSRGLGRIRTSNWHAQRFDLTTADGWGRWILSDHQQPPPSAGSAIRNALSNGFELPEFADKRNRIVIEAEASLEGEVLIRSPNDRAAGPDVMHLKTGGRPVISGTSLAGAMRAHALKIAQLVQDTDRETAEASFVSPLFGPRHEGDGRPDFNPRASRLRISESFIDGGTDPAVTRVAIDRFTQGTVDGALFEEQPHAGGAVRLRFEIRNPLPHELGLLLLVVRDLLTGRLPVGGASSVGRGVLKGTRLSVGTAGEIKGPFQFTNGVPPDDAWLEEQVRAFVGCEPVESNTEGVTE